MMSSQIFVEVKVWRFKYNLMCKTSEMSMTGKTGQGV